MLKSVSKLRLLVDETRDAYLRGDVNYIIGLDGIAERIEQEVSERFMELPLDADGVPIRVGDVMEFSSFEIEKPVTRMVDGIGQGVFFAWCGERGYQQHEAKRYRHHHAPTVEDVLRDVVTLCHNTWKEGSAFEFYDVDDVMKSGNIADFADKLRLAGDVE